MIRPAHHGIEVWLCVEPVNFRKQIAGLATLVQDRLSKDPFSSQLFAFTNRRRTQCRSTPLSGASATPRPRSAAGCVRPRAFRCSTRCALGSTTPSRRSRRRARWARRWAISTISGRRWCATATTGATASTLTLSKIPSARFASASELAVRRYRGRRLGERPAVLARSVSEGEQARPLRLPAPGVRRAASGPVARRHRSAAADRAYPRRPDLNSAPRSLYPRLVNDAVPGALTLGRW